ncbi:phosphoribosylglycinamide formyltransferase [Gordonia shandongensis]|uniref:phosphoribosylglycinamide formyltransferase n=1 Tax=Gordonia shandongensis TaxID=376351 RepID=UPI0006858C76|nr:phosphoribosylglycinamide formyltransferase [Gordonia shandongensis]
MASGAGSLMAAVLDASVTTGASFRVVGVVVDRECGAAERALDAGLPAVLCEPGDYPDRAAWDEALAAAVAELDPQWVVTAGFMKILGPRFLDRFGGRIVNSHPALLPAFAGAHGVTDALAYGVKVTGTTVHLVDAGVDTGPILAQRTVEVLPEDTDDTLHERIKEVERVLLPDVLHAIVTRGVVTDGRKAHIK